MKIVFDTNTVISALLFRGKLAALVEHWQQPSITPLICQQTQAEFIRVLAYPKFKLSQLYIDTLTDYYLAYTEMVDVSKPIAEQLPQCRDDKDQILLQLAAIGQANFLVTGDADLLVLQKQKNFAIITPLDYLKLYSRNEHEQID